MKLRCDACGVEKDPSVKEIYPYSEDGLIDEPIEPFMRLDCGFFTEDDYDWRVVSVCHACFHKIDPDMWINQQIWESLDPAVPFEDLPKLQINGREL